MKTNFDLFKEEILSYYRRHARSFPWRETFDPYRILVSEVMLQQTGVDRVRDKYLAFIGAFPEFAALARSPLAEVLSVWQGLGYNRRAVALHNCAKNVMAAHGGELPSSVAALEGLPGIGAYTARAVAAFAFGIPTPLIETNIRSVFIHHFFADRERVKDAEILPLVAQSLDEENPRQWYYALMDYGAMLKKKHGNPNRKSAHRARQAPFQGSNRERRSRILRAVLEMPGISKGELETLCCGDGLEVNLARLEVEGFLRQEQGRYYVG